MRGLSFDPGERCAFVVGDQACAGQKATLISCGILDRASDDARIAEAHGLLVKYEPDIVFVETVGFVVARVGFSPDMAGHLVAATELAGRLRQLALDHGFVAEKIRAEEWRKQIVGTATPTNAQITPVIRLRFHNWPAQSNNHERDAGGLFLYGIERALRTKAGVPQIALMPSLRSPTRKRKLK